jgi:hypothetical protein
MHAPVGSLASHVLYVKLKVVDVYSMQIIPKSIDADKRNRSLKKYSCCK